MGEEPESPDPEHDLADGGKDAAADDSAAVETPPDATDEATAGPAKHAVTYGPAAGYERSRDEPWRDRVKDVLSPRWLVVLLGAFVVQFGFIGSYVGAFHHQDPHALTVTVVSHNNWQNYVANKLNATPGHALWAYASTDEAAARQQLKDGKRQAVYLFNPDSTKDVLLVNSAEGASISTAMEGIFNQVAASEKRSIDIQDVVPVQVGDARGLTGFYLVVGWLVGGYLVATMLGMRGGTKARNFRRQLWRVIGCVAYGAVSGLGGAFIVGPLIGALTGHFWALAGIGWLVSMTASIFTVGMEALFGIVGVGVSIVIFVVLGNPSAGGAYGYQLLPGFWRTIGPWLPNGAGVDAVRSTVYLGNSQMLFHLSVLVWWLLAGLFTVLMVSNNTYWGFRQEHSSAPDEAISGGSPRP